MQNRTVIGLLTTTLLGCAEDSAPMPSGPQVAIDLAPLTLAGVGDVVWDLEVVNGASTPSVVFRQRVASSVFGDGQGSAAFVGPCDASPGASENTVHVWVVGVYAAPVASVGTFASGAAGGVVGQGLDVVSPTTTAPLTQTVTCSANRDAPVRFDVALMRPATQGFFDVAVSFSDIFCSAKVDTTTTLLFDATDTRASTTVVALACTAGPGASTETELYLSAITLDCVGDTGADLVIDPSAGPGNVCVAGDVGSCAAVASPSGTDPETYLFQVATYRGVEALEVDGQTANKTYWTVALGVERPAIAACRLHARASADDASDGRVADGVVPGGMTYPYIVWDVPLDGSVGSAPLSFGGGAVHTGYSGGGGLSFGYAYGEHRAAGPTGQAPTDPGDDDDDPPSTGCGNLGPCPDGFSCVDATCRNLATEEVYIPAGDFWMGCNTAIDDQCQSNWEVAQHRVTLSAFAIDRTEVTAAQFAACVHDQSMRCQPPFQSADYPTYHTYERAGFADHPMNYVAWTYAQDYCENHGKRLCTEAEWEKAARGGCETLPDGVDCKTNMRIWPWGNTAPDCTKAQLEGCAGNTAAVGTHPAGASPYGVQDMAGNILEWTSERFVQGYSPDPVTDPPGPPTWTNPNENNTRVCRGGHFDSNPQLVRASQRARLIAANATRAGGFRCCRDL